MLIPQRVNHAEGVVDCCAEEWGLLGTPQQSSVVEKLEFSKEYSGFCFACDNQQVVHHSCRKAADWRDSSHKCTAFSTGRPSLQGHHKPGIAGFSTKSQHSLTTGTECGVCLLRLLLWNHFAKILCKSSFPLHGHFLGRRGRVLVLFYNLLKGH